MKARRSGSYLAVMMVPALLLAFSASAPAAQTNQTGVTGQRDVYQQDPNNPPDCTKYPKDTRCKPKK